MTMRRWIAVGSAALLLWGFAANDGQAAFLWKHHCNGAYYNYCYPYCAYNYVGCGPCGCRVYHPWLTGDWFHYRRIQPPSPPPPLPGPAYTGYPGYPQLTGQSAQGAAAAAAPRTALSPNPPPGTPVPPDSPQMGPPPNSPK